MRVWVLVCVMGLCCGAVCRGGSATAEAAKQEIIKNLSDFSAAGISRRFGPDYEFFHKTPVKETPPALIWLRPDKEVKGKRTYQVGGDWTKSAGDYSSTQGQIVYFPEQGPGVDRVSIHQMDHNNFCQKPEAPWNSGFRPEPSVNEWNAAAGGALGVPLGMARGLGTWSNCGVILFSSGFIGTAGTVTAKGDHPSVMLPKEKLPIAITVTPRNEFALVTVYDAQKKMAQIAVIVLTGGGDKRFVHEWPEKHPGVANVAYLTGMKLVGYVDLPGIVGATGITATGNNLPGRLSGPDGNAGLLKSFDLNKQSDRDSFGKGNNRTYTNSAGFAVVTARYENKAVFVDLQPMFEYVREMMFTTDENFKKTRDQGPAPGQWPYAFEKEPRWAPKVIATVDVKEPMSAVASLTGGAKARAFIASLDGTVGIYHVGGLATEAPALPQEIARTGQFTVGRNPICMTIHKNARDSFVVASRGDREIAWFKLDVSGKEAEKPKALKKGQPAPPAAPVLPTGADTATVTRRLKDARMIDPVNVEVADTHGIETHFITVADFKGKKIINYRCSPIKFATQGGAVYPLGEDGKAEFECGGVMEFPGFPFCVSASNVN